MAPAVPHRLSRLCRGEPLLYEGNKTVIANPAAALRHDAFRQIHRTAESPTGGLCRLWAAAKGRQQIWILSGYRNGDRRVQRADVRDLGAISGQFSTSGAALGTKRGAIEPT